MMLSRNLLALAGVTALCLSLAACSEHEDTATSEASLREAVPTSEIAPLEDIDDLLPLATERTHSTTTPMGKPFEALASRTATREELASLADAARTLPVPPSVARLHYEALPVDLYPGGSPSPDDVQQHAIGDCSALAVMAELAYLAPRFVESLIVDHGDGTYGVRMFDPTGRRLTVNVDSRFLTSSHGEIGAVSSRSGRADWATVLEKAIVKYLTVFPVRDEIGGIGSATTAALFTGDGDSRLFPAGTLDAAQMARLVRTSLGRGDLVTGGFRAVVPFGDVSTRTAHSYSVLVPGAEGSMLAMRNPWGANPLRAGGKDRSRDGVLDMPETSAWADQVNLRIIASGAAGTEGRRSPYVPPTGSAAAPRVDDVSP